MSPALQLLADQPVIFWLAAGAGVLAAGVAAGAPALSRGAAAGLVAALAGAVLPGSPAAQAAVFVCAGAALTAVPLRRRRAPAPPASAPAPGPQGADPRLLGRTVRAVDFTGPCGVVAVDGTRLPATLVADAPVPAPGTLLRVVRAGDGELAVRPLQVD